MGLQTIGCGVRDHIATISKLQADRKALTKQVKLLQQEAAQSLGQSLAQRAATQVSLLLAMHDSIILTQHESVCA